jgi:hypothetical protein
MDNLNANREKEINVQNMIAPIIPLKNIVTVNIWCLFFKCKKRAVFF